MRIAGKTIDVEGMSIEEIDALVNACSALKEQKRQERLTELRAKAASMAEASGFDLAEIFAPTVKKADGTRTRKQRYVYQHPIDAKLRWNGFGPHPKWMKAILNSGKYKMDQIRKPL